MLLRRWKRRTGTPVTRRQLCSATNFYFATHNRVPAKVIFEELKKRDIFVRYWNKPRIDNYLRITVGTDAEMETLIAALTEILAAY